MGVEDHQRACALHNLAGPSKGWSRQASSYRDVVQRASALRFKGKMAIFEAQDAVNLGKKTNLQEEPEKSQKQPEEQTRGPLWSRLKLSRARGGALKRGASHQSLQEEGRLDTMAFQTRKGNGRGGKLVRMT